MEESRRTPEASYISRLPYFVLTAWSTFAPYIYFAGHGVQNVMRGNRLLALPSEQEIHAMLLRLSVPSLDAGQGFVYDALDLLAFTLVPEFAFKDSMGR